jgi:hypothetical protein
MKPAAACLLIFFSAGFAHAQSSSPAIQCALDAEDFPEPVVLGVAAERTSGMKEDWFEVLEHGFEELESRCGPAYRGPGWEPGGEPAEREVVDLGVRGNPTAQEVLSKRVTYVLVLTNVSAKKGKKRSQTYVKDSRGSRR